MQGKKFVTLVTLIMMIIGMQACSSSEDAELEYIPVKVDKGDRWGMIDPSGKMLFNDEFENEPSPVINGVFTVIEGKGYSVYKAEHKPVLIPGCETLAQAGALTEGLLPIVREGERINLIDINGDSKVTLNPINGKEVISCYPFFTDGNLLILVLGEKYGSIDKNGKVIVNPIYDSMTLFSDGVAIATIDDEESDDIKTLVGYNSNGKELFKIKGSYKFSEQSLFRFGRFPVKKGDVIGFLNKKGEFNKLPSKYMNYIPFSDKYFGVMDSEYKWGLVNGDNEVLIRTKYNDIDYLGDDLFFVKNDDRFQIITSDGEIKTELDDKNAMSLSLLNRFGIATPFYIAGGNKDSYMFYNRDGKPISKGDMYSIGLEFIYNIFVPIQSMFFDVDGIAKYITDGISSTGFENITLRGNINKYMRGEARNYADDYSMSIDMNKFNFMNASASLEVYPEERTELFVLAEPVYSYENYYGYTYQTIDGYSYKWNPASKIGLICISVNSTTPFFGKCKKEIVNTLKTRGFTTVLDGSWSTVLKKDNMYIEIIPNESTEYQEDPDNRSQIMVKIMSANYYNNRIEA